MIPQPSRQATRACAIPAAWGALAVAVLWSTLRLGGTASIVSLGLLLLACLPGAPLGFALFGRRHLAGWIAALALGYAVATLGIWAVVRAGLAGPAAFAAAWVVCGVASLGAARALRPPAVRLPRFPPAGWLGLALLLLMVPLLVTRPLARVGEIDAAGHRLYRAYFIADFAWHTALTAELAKESPQPENPFLAGERLHYYWTYFRVPATLAAQAGIAVDVALKTTALLAALALLATMYIVAWCALPEWPGASAVAVASTVVAASLEGWAAIADVVHRGLPLDELRDINIDAVAAWAFKGLRIDNLPRTMWYTPQHGFACALGLLAMPAAIVAGAEMKASAALLSGCALGASVAFNPLLGAAFCAVYGATLVLRTWRERRPVRSLLRQWLAVLPVGAALAWCALNEVGDGAAGVIHLGFWGPARNATLMTFLLQFGPLLPLAGLGAWAGHRRGGHSLWPAALGALTAVGLMHLVTLTVDLSWVGFRGGNLFFVLIPALPARGIVWIRSARSPRLAAAAVAATVAAGLPTTLLDAFNAQDVENQHLSRDAERVRGSQVAFDPDQEFHWTLSVSPEEVQALRWIRDHTPVDARVQMEPTVRGRETWSLIPSFAERRMVTGNALPLLPRPAYAVRNGQVRDLYASSDAEHAWAEARGLGIDFLYVGDAERRAYPHAAKFDAAPNRFTPVARFGQVAVFQVIDRH